MRGWRTIIAVLSLNVVVTSATSGVQTTAPRSAPIVRIGLGQSQSTILVKSAAPFVVEQNPTRSARFSTILALDPSPGVYRKADLQYRMTIELDDGRLVVQPIAAKVVIQPGTAVLDVDGKTYRGSIEVYGNSRNTLTVVNELPIEEYLYGVVPNELGPKTFPEIEALKAQAVAARTYIVRNLKQYQREGYDICNTDLCQVYYGFGTEDPLATRAVDETRGLVATFGGRPINALYSSTCGGRTENAENIFEEPTPYLVSTMCQYKHPEPLPFRVDDSVSEWPAAVLRVAGVSTFPDARRFFGFGDGPGPASRQPAELATYIRRTFYPELRPTSDLTFLTEIGVLSMNKELPDDEILFRLIDRKNAMEWQSGTILAWDGRMLTLNMAGTIRDFTVPASALIFERIGEERFAVKAGSWVGGEFVDFRSDSEAIQLLSYRPSPAGGQFSDRYSRLASWQIRKTRQELDTAFRALNIGATRGIKVVRRGPSDRPVETQVIGTTGVRSVRALRFRSLLGLRDSLFHFDEERNRQGELLGITFHGRGWGHGVGMCQVGAYGMARDGATAEQILKQYYRGIELTRLYE